MMSRTFFLFLNFHNPSRNYTYCELLLILYLIHIFYGDNKILEMANRINCPYCHKSLVEGFLPRHIQAFHKSEL